MACFIPGCKSGHQSERRKNKATGTKNCSFFSTRSDEMLDAWQKAMPQHINKVFQKKDRICEFHFKEDDVEKDYITKMPDGTVVRMPKGRATLKTKAVPSIFPPKLVTRNKKKLASCEDEHQNPDQHHVIKTETCSTELSAISNTCEPQPILKIEYVAQNHSDSEDLASNTSISDPLDERLLPSEQSVISIKQEEEPILDMSPLDNQADSEDLEQKPIIVESLFSMIVRNYKSIPVPSELWLSCFAYGCVMFTSWNKDLSAVENQIVISPDMTLQYTIKGKEVTFRSMEKIESINDVAQVLQKVSKLISCVGVAGDKRGKGCTGYVFEKNKNQRGPQGRRCVPCKRKHKLELQKIRKSEPLKNQQQKVFLLKKQYENMKRREAQLENKIETYTYVHQYTNMKALKVQKYKNMKALKTEYAEAIKHAIEQATSK